MKKRNQLAKVHQKTELIICNNALQQNYFLLITRNNRCLSAKKNLAFAHKAQKGKVFKHNIYYKKAK
jgi:hypothetical protein